MRTLAEVRHRLNNFPGHDFLGFAREVLRPYLPEEYVEGKQDEVDPLTEDAVKAQMAKYLDFAFGKAINHRGISASRSVAKIGEWLWILGDDEMVAFAQDDAHYQNYGMPILKAVATKYKLPIPKRAAAWEDGKPCRVGCKEGCGA